MDGWRDLTHLWHDRGSLNQPPFGRLIICLLDTSVIWSEAGSITHPGAKPLPLLMQTA